MTTLTYIGGIFVVSISSSLSRISSLSLGYSSNLMASPGKRHEEDYQNEKETFNYHNLR